MLKIRWITLFVVLLSFALTQFVTAEVSVEGLKIKDVRIEKDLGTPIYDVEARGMRINNDDRESWFRLKVEYETDPQWLDELTIDFYVLMTPREEEGVNKKLSPKVYHKKIAYLDIPRSSRHYAAVYMHPHQFRRNYNGDRLEWAVLIKYKGRLLAAKSSLDDKGTWWSRFPSRENVLMSRDETPFVFIDYEDYEIIARTNK